MRRRHPTLVYLGILVIWVQIFAPAAAMSVERAGDPFSVICSHSPPGDPQDEHRDHAHHDCVLCQANLDCPTLVARPLVAAMHHGVASPPRRHHVDAAPPHAPRRRAAQPRGPPALG